MIEIRRYTAADKPEWDDFVKRTKNATFLHLRDYMDYHSDRFHDFSLMARNEHGKLLAVLPANIVDGSLYSHQGLTYGGWLTPVKHFTAMTMLDVWDAMMPFLKDNGIKTLIYKAIPYIYHRYPADEDLYALFRYGAQIAECNISTAVDLSCPTKYNETQRQNIKKAERYGISVSETRNFTEFWDILTDCLRDRHNATPVHTIEEIMLLRSRFPENIRLFGAFHTGGMVAGCLVFIDHQTIHLQYIASSPEGMKLNAVALIHDHLMHNEFASMRYYDFGTSNENHGQVLNKGLITQKCGLGGRGVAYQIYKVNVR